MAIQDCQVGATTVTDMAKARVALLGGNAGAGSRRRKLLAVFNANGAAARGRVRWGRIWSAGDRRRVFLDESCGARSSSRSSWCRSELLWTWFCWPCCWPWAAARRAGARTGRHGGGPAFCSCSGSLLLARLPGLLDLLLVGLAGRLGRIARIDLARIRRRRRTVVLHALAELLHLLLVRGREVRAAESHHADSAARGGRLEGLRAAVRPTAVAAAAVSASETAASPTAVIPAASSERPSGPSRIVTLLFFFITTPVRRFPPSRARRG